MYRWDEMALTNRGATDPAPWLEAHPSHASLRAPRSVNVKRGGVDEHVVTGSGPAVAAASKRAEGAASFSPPFGARSSFPVRRRATFSNADNRMGLVLPLVVWVVLFIVAAKGIHF